MKFNDSFFAKIVGILRDRAVGNRLGNITVINSRDFLISLTANREQKLLVSLDHQNPFLSFIDAGESIPTSVGKTNEIIRKELKDGLITNVEILNEDKILCISLQKTNDYFEREKKQLIFELIPQRSNMIIVGDDNKVIFALNYAPLETVRPLLKGMSYELPHKKVGFIQEQEEINEEELKLFAKDRIRESIRKRLLERYDVLFKHIKSRTKSQKQKLKVLEGEIANANENLKYQEYGTMLLSLADDQESLSQYVKDNNLILKPELTIGQNANLYFKKYKKAKRTIEMDEIELTKAKNEIARFDIISAQLNYMSDEDLYELAMELMPTKFKEQKKNNPQSKVSYVVVDGTKIYFGKNAKQNSEITFKIAKPKNTYLHIKDYHGAHVVIANDNATKEQLLIAAEMCLILSNKVSGDIMFAPISKVKKGNTPGEAFMLNYELITLNKVRESTIELLKGWKN